MVEGKGLVKPHMEELILRRDEIQLLKTEAIRRAEYRRYAKRKDIWGSGLIRGAMLEYIGNIEPAALAILIGLVGEYSTCLFLNRRFRRTVCSTDLVLKPKGDGGIDLEVFGVRIEVKGRKRDYASNLVRFKTEHGQIILLNADVYVFSQWKLREVSQLLGWANIETVQNWETKPAHIGRHFNKEGEDIDLEPMCRLIDFLRVKEKLKK